MINEKDPEIAKRAAYFEAKLKQYRRINGELGPEKERQMKKGHIGPEDSYLTRWRGTNNFWLVSLSPDGVLSMKWDRQEYAGKQRTTEVLITEEKFKITDTVDLTGYNPSQFVFHVTKEGEMDLTGNSSEDSRLVLRGVDSDLALFTERCVETKGP